MPSSAAVAAPPAASRKSQPDRINPSKLVLIGLDVNPATGKVDGPEHTLYDERSQLVPTDRFVRSVSAIGVRLAILVRKNGDVYEVVDGAQRTLAARKVNERRVAEMESPITVPIAICSGENKELMKQHYALNHIRVDDGPVKTARDIKKLLDIGISAAEVMDTFGIGNKTTMQEYEKLLGLHPDIVQDVDDGASFVAAVKLSKMPQEKQAAEWAKMKETGGITVRKAAQVKRHQKDPENVPENPPPKKRLLQKLYKSKDITDEGKHWIGWILGLVKSSRIGGLDELLTEIATKKVKVKKEPKEKKPRTKKEKAK
jgi:ParB-like chromosome segregation protein Spo0J